MIETFLAFAATNIDDIFLLSFLFAEAREKRERLEIVIGQVLGISLLFIFSTLLTGVIKALSFNLLPYLGIFPIILGLRALRRKNEEDPILRTTLLSVTLLTLSNGADNLAVYIPLFATYTNTQLLYSYLIFLHLTIFWCIAALTLTHKEEVKRAIRKQEAWLVPLVLIGLGFMIIFENL